MDINKPTEEKGANNSISPNQRSSALSGVGVSIARKKTRKAIRPGIIDGNSDNNVSKGNTGLQRPSIINRTESSTIYSSNSISARKSESQTTSFNKKKAVDLTEASSKNEHQIMKNIIKKSFKEDFEHNVDANELSEPDINNIKNSGCDERLENTIACPFLVGSGSEASYEKSSEINRQIVDISFGNVDKFDIYEDKCLLEMISEIGIEDVDGALLYRLSNDIEELSSYFTNMIGRLELFGLNIQSKLEKLENELEMSSNVNCLVGSQSLGKENNNDSVNDKFNDIRYERYNYLLKVKDRLLKELSDVEKELVEEEMRINKEESERMIRIDALKNKKNTYKDELSTLTAIICWIEDSLQSYIYPLQKKQSEYKQELNREKEMLSLINEELSKIEKQEKVVLDKIREIQDSKRFRGEEKELLQEQIRISKSSKTEKIKSGNFKEASLITQTIKVLENEVSQIDDKYVNITNQEKEFIEKIDRIKRNYNNELKRMDECKKELILCRKLKRKELMEELFKLKSCEFSFSEIISEDKNGIECLKDCNNDTLSCIDSIKKIFETLSSQLKNQINSVLSYEMTLLENQDAEDDSVLQEFDSRIGKVENTEDDMVSSTQSKEQIICELTCKTQEVTLNDRSNSTQNSTENLITNNN